MKHRPLEFIHAATAPRPARHCPVAANLVHAEVPAGVPFTSEQQLVLEKYQSGFTDKAEDVASKLDKLEARLQSKQEYELSLAETETGIAQQQHLADACSKYAEATRLAPDLADAYSNWGNALLGLAKNETGTAQQQHLDAACSKYAEVTRLQPDSAPAYSNWGIALLYLVHFHSGSEREDKLREAERVLLQAKVLGHSNPYNLACLRAIQHRTDDARELLLQTREAGYLPDYAHLGSDKDLENLRELDWFKDLLEDVRQQEAVKTTQPA